MGDDGKVRLGLTMSQDLISPEQRRGIRILVALAVFSFQDAGSRVAAAQDAAPQTATPVPAPGVSPNAPKGEQSAPTPDRPAAAVQPSTSESICLLVESAAQAHGLPFEFFARLIWQESRFQPNAVGPMPRNGQGGQGL